MKGKCLYGEEGSTEVSWQFKEGVAKRMLNGDSPTQLNRELGIVLSKLCSRLRYQAIHNFQDLRRSKH